MFEEKTISSETIYEGKILKLRRDEVTTKNGTSYREIVEHNGASVVIAITDEDKILMVRQYRKPIEMPLLELPAGKIDAGEDSETAALRELREETGYRANNIKFITKMYTSVGFCNEVLYLYLCTDLIKGETEFDAGEDLDLYEYSLDELNEMVMSGEINDAKSQVGILMASALNSRGILK